MTENLTASNGVICYLDRLTSILCVLRHSIHSTLLSQVVSVYWRILRPSFSFNIIILPAIARPCVNSTFGYLDAYDSKIRRIYTVAFPSIISNTLISFINFTNLSGFQAKLSVLQL